MPQSAFVPPSGERSSFIQLAAGVGFAAAVAVDGTLWLWGGRFGEAPTRFPSDDLSPSRPNTTDAIPRSPAVPTTFVEVSAGGSAVLARAADGRLFTLSGGTDMLDLPVEVSVQCTMKKGSLEGSPPKKTADGSVYELVRGEGLGVLRGTLNRAGQRYKERDPDSHRVHDRVE